MKKLFTIIILGAMVCGLVALSVPRVSMAVDLGSGVVFNTPSPSDDTTGGGNPIPKPPSPN